MEDVAAATRNNAALMQAVMHKQMRAYVTVDTGRAIYQDASLVFEYAPVLRNTAKNISYKITADILPNELQEDFTFRDYGNERSNDASLAPRQEFVIRGIVQKVFSEEEVAAIMRGDERRLYAWGEVTYTDVFGDSWHTNFCHSVLFNRLGPEGLRTISWTTWRGSSCTHTRIGFEL